MKDDAKTTIKNLRELLRKFRDERDWKQFHDPKNLTEAISVEVGELLELFLWNNKKEIIERLKSDERFKEEVKKEFADVIIFCLNFANSTDIDISKAVKEKIQENERKYPVEKAKGNATKYNKL